MHRHWQGNFGVSWTCHRSLGSFQVIMSQTKHFFFKFNRGMASLGPVFQKKALKVLAEFFATFLNDPNTPLMESPLLPCTLLLNSHADDIKWGLLSSNLVGPTTFKLLHFFVHLKCKENFEHGRYVWVSSFYGTLKSPFSHFFPSKMVHKNNPIPTNPCSKIY